MKLRELWRLRFGTEEQQRKLKRRTLKRAARDQGYYLYSPHMVWKEQPFFLEARKRAAGVVGIADPRCYVLQSAIRSVAGVVGDVAECGVRQAKSTLFMRVADPVARSYHLFDSFAGLPKPTQDDVGATGSSRWSEGDLSTDEAIARRTLEGFADTHFHVGWIPDTLPAVAGRRFALVHIDVDLYEPTRDSLAFFYERTAPGGVLICDDYGSAHCPGARKAFDEFLADKPEGLIELPTGQALVHKR